MTLSMHVIIWVVCIIRGEATAADTLSWGVRFWLVTAPISAAWCALATFVGSLFKTPMVSLLAIFASFFVLWLVWLIGQVTHAQPLTFVYPNAFDAMLVHPHITRGMTGLAACVATAALYLGAGAFIFKKRDV
jgi:hypothetical protein